MIQVVYEKIKCILIYKLILEILFPKLYIFFDYLIFTENEIRETRPWGRGCGNRKSSKDDVYAILSSSASVFLFLFLFFYFLFFTGLEVNGNSHMPYIAVACLIIALSTIINYIYIAM